MNVSVFPTVIYACMMGMTLFALIETRNKPKHRQISYLRGLLALLLIHILGELYIFTGAYQYAPGIAGAQFPLRTLLGPALYFYAYATMSPEQQLPGKSFLLALTGPLLVSLVMIPFVFGITPEQKLALADPATRDPELWKIALSTCLAAMVIFISFTMIYLVAALRLHTRHKQQIMQRFSAIEKRSLDWFRKVLLLWGLAWLLFTADFGMGFLGVRWFGSGFVLPLLELTALMLFAHLALKQPVLNDSERGNIDAVHTQPRAQNDQPRTATLSVERMAQVAYKLKTVMEQDELFKEEDLSLNRLSNTIDVSENHISETLSQHLKTNFFHFVNGYRVEAAKQLLRNSNKLVSTIAYDVGFNSKSTFNSAFKKAVGDTPTAFRNQDRLATSEEAPP